MKLLDAGVGRITVEGLTALGVVATPVGWWVGAGVFIFGTTSMIPDVYNVSSK